MSRSEPILGGWAVLGLAPVLCGYTAVPCLLAALASGAASSFAEQGWEGEINAASASGIGPLRWLAPVALLGVLVTPWTLWAMAELFPAAKAAKHAQHRLLLRSPEVCLRLLDSSAGYLGKLRVALEPLEGGRFQDLWLVELGETGLPGAVWRAREGSVGVPADRDVLRFELDGVRVWRPDPSGDLLQTSAKHVTLDRTLRSLSRRTSQSAKSLPRERTLAALLAGLDDLAQGPERDLARSEISSRLALGLAPVPLLLAAVAVGLRTARLGPWGGFVAGIFLTGGFFFPAHATCARLVADGGSVWLAALPAVLLLAGSLPSLLRWRSG